jgi:hypothetical protein
MVIDLLWSDPTDNEEAMGIVANTTRDPQKQNNIMQYGPDQVEKFLEAHNFSIIIRSHQSCPEGIDRFAEAQLITVSSCSNYGGTHNNDASFLVL